VHNGPSIGFTDIDDAYAIITDITNGDMFNATTGAVTTTYTDAVVAFTKDAQNTDWACGTIPKLDNTKQYAITVYETAGTPAAGDTIKISALLYNPDEGKTYTDTNPIRLNQVITRRGHKY
jgi:hypothetical protein